MKTHRVNLGMLTWVPRFDDASHEARHLIIAVLVERIGLREGNEIRIQLKVSVEQFLGQESKSACADENPVEFGKKLCGAFFVLGLCLGGSINIL